MSCPYCGTVLGLRGQYYDAGTKTLRWVVLKPGEKAVCTKCAQVTVMTGKDTYRKMTMEEELALPDTEREVLSWSQLIVIETNRDKIAKERKGHGP